MNKKTKQKNYITIIVVSNQQCLLWAITKNALFWIYLHCYHTWHTINVYSITYIQLLPYLSIYLKKMQPKNFHISLMPPPSCHLIAQCTIFQFFLNVFFLTLICGLSSEQWKEFHSCLNRINDKNCLKCVVCMDWLWT